MRPSLPRAVIALGLVSLFTDLSSEMVYPLLLVAWVPRDRPQALTRI